MAASVISLLGAAESALWDLISYHPRWGVFNPGTNVKAVEVDSVVDLATRRESQTSDYRIETGSFASYNKVQRPAETAVRLSVGGNESARAAFLQWLEDNVQATALFDVAMPERTLSNATLVSYAVRRDSRSGVTLLIADCYFVEIRQVTAQYSNSKAADTSGAAQPGDTPAAPTVRAQAATPGTAATNQAAGVPGWQ